MNWMAKHVWLVPKYVRLAVRRQSEYKASFYTFLAHQVMTVGVWLIFWKMLLGKIGDIGSWNFPRMVLLTGFVTINAGMWLTFVAVWRLPREVLTGQLNSHLIKPVHPFLHFLFREINLRSVPRLFVGIGVLTVGLNYYDVGFSGQSLLLAGMISALSFLTTFLPFATICLAAFWIGQAEFIRDLFIELFVFQNYPLSEFPNAFIFVFSLVIPLIFSATVPVLVLTQFSTAQALGLLAGMVVIIAGQLTLFSFLWKRGLRRYESFGG